MTRSFSRKKHSDSIVFAVFIIVNIVMLCISVYTLYFSSSSPFTETRIRGDFLFWVGAFNNLLLISGLWIFIDVIFSIFFYIKNR